MSGNLEYRSLDNSRGLGYPPSKADPPVSRPKRAVVCGLGAGVENAMKAPTPLLLLALAAAASVSAAAPVSAQVAHRCDVAWLKQAQAAVDAKRAPDDPKKYLKTEPSPAGPREVFDVQSVPKVCDATVWHYLVGRGPVLRWSDEGLKQDWETGLGEQIKILLAVDAFYGATDALGADGLVKGDAILNTAAKLGVVTIKPAGGLDRLRKAGDTAGLYADRKGLMVGPPDPNPAALKPDELAAALNKLLADAPAAKGAPAAVKPSAAVRAFQASVFRVANLLARSAKSRPIAAKYGIGAKVKEDFQPGSAVPAFSPVADPASADAAAYARAVKFLTDAAIASPDDGSAHEAAALSRLDYGLRNMLAVDAAGVEAAVQEAKKRLKGQSVAAAVAAARRDAKAPAKPDAPKPGSMAADVLEKLKGVKNYQDLNALYDKNKADAQWLSGEDGQAVVAELNGLRADAGKTTVVKGPDGKRLNYGVGGEASTADGIVVARLDKDQAYRTWAAETIAKNIASNPLSARAQAALDAFLGKGASGTPVSPPPTPDQQNAGQPLGPQPPAPTAPSGTAGAWNALVAATPTSGFFGRIIDIFSGSLWKGDATRYYSKVNEAVARTASDRSSQRTRVEAEANAAAAAAQRKDDAERRKIELAPADPDDSAAVATAKRKAALAAHDAQVAADVKTARQKVVDDAKAKNRYVDAASAAADRKKALDALNATVDAAYSDGIEQSVGKLQLDYKLEGSRRRLDAERRSGYSGQYYKLDRVDRFFHENWEGDKQKPAIAACKTSLGFQMNGDGGNFKDPSLANVDELCGVRDGLVALLKSYKGTNTTLPVPGK